MRQRERKEGEERSGAETIVVRGGATGWSQRRSAAGTVGGASVERRPTRRGVTRRRGGANGGSALRLLRIDRPHCSAQFAKIFSLQRIRTI
ncbi:hypothetical protein chiPu_0031144 [Chiloscyllium punctatum]|uniref:Uncharacterized protein n=1 Tax=Chiloscyllium punctatum TaxID=137246 RepID=A0A401TX16_CHIPU|nr:hypothetical protein [Chiloscyllium punctatum]